MTTLDDRAPAVSHPIGRHGSVAIKLASAEIRLTGTDGEHAVVRTAAGRTLPDRVVVETTEGSLVIREREPLGLTFGPGGKTIHLDLDLPAAADLGIDIASGEIDAIGLRGEQRYRSVSGDTRLHGGAGRIELNAVSGDIEIQLAGPADLAAKTVSGDVAVAGGELTTVRVGTTSGDVRIDTPITGRTGNQIDTLSGDVSLVADHGMRIEARTVSGDLTSDLPHRSEGRMGRRTLIVGDGSIEVGFRSVSGDLRVHAANRSPERRSAAPVPPVPPVAPVPPVPPVGPVGPTSSEPPEDRARAHDVTSDADASDSVRMDILRALEAGELDVATAMDRLADLDARDEERSDG